MIELGPGQYLPRALNDAGQVTGYLSDVLANGQALNTAFVFTPGQGVRLLDPAQSFRVSYGMDINNRGQIALSADAQAYRWDSRSGFEGLGSFVINSFTTPHAINNAGVVTGDSWIRGVTFTDPGQFRTFVARPFLYTPDGVLTPLGTLGLADSFVNGVNTGLTATMRMDRSSTSKL